MFIIDNILQIILDWMYFANQHLYWLGLLSGAFLLSLDAEDDSKMKILYAVLGCISVLPGGAYFVIQYLANVVAVDTMQSKHFAWLWLGSSVISWLVAFLWLRVGVQKMDVIAEILTAKSELERNKKTDMREMDKHRPSKVLEFDVLKHLNKKKGVFLGLNEEKNAKYIEFGGGTSAPHVQVIGTTGAGKGVVLGIMATQFLEMGEAVFWCDPKNDEWAPSVMYAAAKRTGKPYHYINLNRPNGAQFNLFEDATEDEAFELFQAGFGLIEKGDASDYYGIDDRKEAGITARLMAREKLTIAQAYGRRIAELENPDEGKKFYGRLREMAETPSINATSGGVSLEKIIQEGGCVYIVGSMRNDIVKTAQRILLVRLIQLCERRDRMAGALRKVCVVLDEVKYHLSRPALEGLGAARDKGMHLVLAHQSLGDLKDCTKDLNPDAVVDAVVENCRIKICYKVQSPVTAEWLAAMSGKILVDDETRTVKRNLAHAETVNNERTIRQAERFLIDENMLLDLKPQTAALYGAGLPQFISIQPIKVPKEPNAIRIVECEGGAVESTAEKLAGLEVIESLAVDHFAASVPERLVI